MRNILLTLLAALWFAAGTPADELTCLTEDQRAEAQLYAQLQQHAYTALDRRKEAYEELETPEQIRAYQQERRDFFVTQLGGFPERTPLNAKTVGTIAEDGYRIEKVIFESQPNHRITANLYLPDSETPVPGVVVSSGHSRTAKTADYNQRFGIMMAKHKMAALCFDPIGQGERSQILDEQGEPKFSGTTTEHSLIGVGSILVGRNTARYRVWDAIRSIDYLASRPEVDADRIGFTGCSGGGTLTSYVMALDDRVACAAPACYLTTFRRLIETIGPQDAEQNIFGQLAFGLDQPDYVLLRAPRPTLISSTTDDFFDIQGSWDNFRQAKRVYGKLGFPERVDLVEVEGTHGVKPQGLATIAHWMQRWLLDRDEPVAAVELGTRAPEELMCTESGQVLTSSGEQSVFDLNAARETELAKQREDQWSGAPRDALATEINTLIGRPDGKPRRPTSKSVGRVERDDYAIEKHVIRTDSEAWLPALTFLPSTPSGEVYLYLHEEGKAGDTDPGGPVEEIVKAGHVVLTVDLRGQGETSAGERDALLPDWKTYFLGYLLGKPLVGMRVTDALDAATLAADDLQEGSDAGGVHLVGVGHGGIVALHAAALVPERFASVTLRDTPRDWASIVRDDVPSGQLDSSVHGALEVYDLPDLVRLAGEDTVRYEE